jgi:RluA family pseudouridine synthase
MLRIVSTRIDARDAGKGLLDWLCTRFLYADRATWLSFIESGSVLVDGKSTVADSVLTAGATVSFEPQSFEEPAVDTDIRIVHETSDILVVDKPPELPCHPGGRYFEHTLWFILSQRHPRIHIATRLDRGTSGLVLVCLTTDSSRAIRRAMDRGGIDKRYLVIVHGDFPDTLEARGRLVPDTSSPVRKKRRFIPDEPRSGLSVLPSQIESARGEACLTWFRTRSRSGGFSLVEARLGTGRTHQIRASLCSLGYPVVGDTLYGIDDRLFLRFLAGSLDAADRSRLILNSQALHCTRLAFPLPSGSPESSRGRPERAGGALPEVQRPSGFDMDKLESTSAGTMLGFESPPPWPFPPVC